MSKSVIGLTDINIQNFIFLLSHPSGDNVDIYELTYSCSSHTENPSLLHFAKNASDKNAFYPSARRL